MPLNTIALELVPPNRERSPEQLLDEAHKVRELGAQTGIGDRIRHVMIPGMIAEDDVILALSWSGETAELKNLIDYSRRHRIALIGMTSEAASTLGRAADVVLTLPQAREACPHNLAPTTSSLMQLALGDALAIALLERRGFSAEDFGTLHPGGALGRRLRRVDELMHTGAELPLVSGAATMADVLREVSAKRLGLTGVLGADGTLAGIITDGDLRRAVQQHGDVLRFAASELMTRAPKTVPAGALAESALALMEQHAITALFIVDAEGRPAGVLHLHDLLRAAVV